MLNEEGVINKLATAAIIGLLGWNIATTQKLSVDVAVAVAQLNGIKEQLDKAPSASTVDTLGSRLTRAEVDLADIQRRINDVERVVGKGQAEDR